GDPLPPPGKAPADPVVEGPLAHEDARAIAQRGGAGRVGADVIVPNVVVVGAAAYNGDAAPVVAGDEIQEGPTAAVDVVVVGPIADPDAVFPVGNGEGPGRIRADVVARPTDRVFSHDVVLGGGTTDY